MTRKKIIIITAAAVTALAAVILFLWWLGGRGPVLTKHTRAPDLTPGQVEQVTDYGTVVKAVPDKELTYASAEAGKNVTVKPAPGAKFQYASYVTDRLLDIPVGAEVYAITDGEGLLYGLYTPLLPPEHATKKR
ncbi:hypothetical protein Tfer_2780 [Thermincola ferriacetica]|uniref:Uncharacterized protein n=1 Tax=Thermincola ferriacetica TaxID=281456 RepID=A0A0L6VZQ0_9FIRM|nr:hypothetical protein [Thermincola ferriacetica]KNZ68686.1 hypothetical protein Tfer_2780 [Thermincola ferriacetica]